MRNSLVVAVLFALVLASAAHAEIYTCQAGDNMWNWISKQPPQGLGLYDTNDTSNMWKAVWAVQAINNQIAKSGDVTPIVDESLVRTGEKYWLPGADLLRQVIQDAEGNATGTGTQAFKDAAAAAARSRSAEAQSAYTQEATGQTATPTPTPATGTQTTGAPQGGTIPTNEFSLLGSPPPAEGFKAPDGADDTALVGPGLNGPTEVLVSEELFAEAEPNALGSWWNPLTWWSWFTEN